jgi:hypothetical protein
VRSKQARLALVSLAAFAALILTPWAYLSGLGGGFRRGEDIRRYGLVPDRTPGVEFIWAPSAREPVATYARRKGRNLAHFTGSILLSRPGDAHDGTEIGIVDGKFSYSRAFPDGDRSLAAVLHLIRTRHLRAMIERTPNDWRIYNDANHFVPPDPAAFTGRIVLDPSGWFVFVRVLEVENNRITRVSRQFIAMD